MEAVETIQEEDEFEEEDEQEVPELKYDDIFEEGELGSSEGSGDEKKSSSKQLIVLSSPMLVGTGIKKHTEYKVTSRHNSSAPEVDVHRRYKHFEWLQTILRKKFPGIFVPPLPPKKRIGNTDVNFVHLRQRQLQRFLNRVFAIPLFRGEESVSHFLTHTPSCVGLYDDICNRMTKDVLAETLQETKQRYEKLFPSLASQHSLDTATTKANVAALVPKLQRLVTVANAIVADKCIAVDSSRCLGMAAINLRRAAHPVAEMVGYSELSASDDDFWANYLQSAKQEAVVFHQLLAAPFLVELWDAQAFLQAIETRDQVFKMTTHLCQESAKWKQEDQHNDLTDQDKKQREIDQQAEEDAKDLLYRVTTALLHKQLPDFWRFRMARFRSTMHAFAKEQLDNTKTLVDMWGEAVNNAKNVQVQISRD
mmetsp:Transcript_51011/g.99995  ORF Transcript_51011/g.99995 Transcript_51011/m.99995 type:complete len:423 (+) Transcript_51011:45-1313(+)|eukprot:CAMPEP_0175130664 /NCGR_PEP_ID=MMETSP0087-20121206/6125_1 /TAXON_ID=136419 /ORGANISM="Unknown Unknown, Strain D1" /LENGTH=422 /DNA_ID=CAMNT_0016412893 /DNA_START=41 /DNA_END=1309 /DNA_ORIENTATION=+